MPASKQDNDFARIISEDHIDEIKISSSALDAAIEFIATNFSPDDIFETSELEIWAERNGYVKE